MLRYRYSKEKKMRFLVQAQNRSPASRGEKNKKIKSSRFEKSILIKTDDTHIGLQTTASEGVLSVRISMFKLLSNL